MGRGDEVLISTDRGRIAVDRAAWEYARDYIREHGAGKATDLDRDQIIELQEDLEEFGVLHPKMVMIYATKEPLGAPDG